jgi:putative ABC transport system substrate-binding protein
MRRRAFIAGLGSVAAWSVVARAQQAAMPVIAWLDVQPPDVAFLQGLKETGYVVGQNAAIEYRWAENQRDRLPALAADLVRRRVAVIVGGTAGALAAKAATTTIPIVMATCGDPVALGLVDSLNRPGGNVTGITNFTVELGPKQLQLLRQLLPDAGRFGALADPADPNTQFLIPDLQAAARTLRLQLDIVNASNDNDVEMAFATFPNSVLVPSWSAPVPSTTSAWNNSWLWQPVMRCPRSSSSVSSSWPAA